MTENIIPDSNVGGSGELCCGDNRLDESKPDFSGVKQVASRHRVLVVDDEPVVRMLIVDILDELGYPALEAEDGRSGLAALQGDPSIDMLITDVGLPGGINGYQMANEARQLRGKLKVLFITGYADTAEIGTSPADESVQFMSKPFAVDALATKISAMLQD